MMDLSLGMLMLGNTYTHFSLTSSYVTFMTINVTLTVKNVAKQN